MAKREQTTGQPKARKPQVAPVVPPSGASTSPAPRRITNVRLPDLQRDYATRAEREDVVQRIIIITTGLVALVVVLLLAGALLLDQVIVPNRVVARVNGEAITVRDFRQRVRAERVALNDRLNEIFIAAQNAGIDLNQVVSTQPYATWWNETNDGDLLGSRVIEDLVDEMLMRQQAAALGVTVDPARVEEARRQFFGYDPDALAAASVPTATPTITPTPFVSPTPSPTPVPTLTATPAADATAESVDATPLPTLIPTVMPTLVPTISPTEAADAYNTNREAYYAAARSTARLDARALDSYFEAQALRLALRDALGADIGDDAEHVNARHILVATEDEAQDVLAALQAGELFSNLARAVSTDQGSAAQGGELGWTPLVTLDEAFAEAAANAELGALVGPVESQFGFHIIQVRAREMRPLDDSQQQQARAARFNTWLEEQRAAQEANIEVLDTWLDNIPDGPQFVFRGV